MSRDRAGMDAPMLIIVSGLPGTGKSAVADAIGAALRSPVLSVDPIESAILRSGIGRDQPTDLAAYLVAEALADACLAIGLSPIVDAVSGVEPARAMWRTLVARHGTTIRVIECICSDEAIHRARLVGRDRGLEPYPEPSWDVVLDRAAEWVPWPEERLVLDAVDPLEENARRAIAYLGPVG